MATSERIPTRILVLSDTHSALPDPVNRPELDFSHELPAADVAIHCGDLTSCGKDYEHERAITLLKSLPAPIKIVIPGNHDMTLDPVYLQHNRRLHGWTRPHNAKDLRDAIAIYTDREAKEAGIRYIVEGLHSFTLPNGAKLTLYASAFTPEFCNWGFGYPRSQDRFNASKERLPDNTVPAFTHKGPADMAIADQVTVMVTHGPPRGILDRTTHGESVGCDHLLTAVSRCRPLLHCFGHIHEAWGAETRLWPGEAENGGIIGSEAAELRRSSETSGKAQNGSDTVDFQDQSRTVKETHQIEPKSTDGTSAITTEESRVLITHPIEPPDIAALGQSQVHRNTSVVDARAVEHGKQTVFVNASIMDVRYVPCQRPWLVQIELPRASEEEMENS